MNREVLVKTLIGKGRRYLVKKVELDVLESASKTLGCWIINHHVDAICHDKKLFIKGSYDVELWMAIDNDQKSQVFRTKIEFDEEIDSAFRDLLTLDDEFFLKTIVLRYPSCTAMKLKEGENKVEVTIESEYLIDVFAEALLVISSLESKKADMTLDEEILMNVNTDYLKIPPKQN